MTRFAWPVLGAVIITGLLLAAAAQLVRERPHRQDITAPVPVSLVTVPRDPGEPEPEKRREPEPPPKEPQPDFAPELPAVSLTAPTLRGPSVSLDPGMFGVAPVTGPMVFEAGDLDQPPRGIVREEVQYPPKALQRRTEGTVRVRFLVRIDGTVGEIIIEDSTPPGVFDRAVRDAVSRWRFEPGRLAGESVAAWVVMPIRFDLRGGGR